MRSSSINLSKYFYNCINLNLQNYRSKLNIYIDKTVGIRDGETLNCCTAGIRYLVIFCCRATATGRWKLWLASLVQTVQTRIIKQKLLSRATFNATHPLSFVGNGQTAASKSSKFDKINEINQNEINMTNKI